MPEYVVHRVAEALNDQSKAIKGSQILILGLAYKPNVDDERESPSYRLLEKLKQRGAIVAYHDPHVPVIRPTREHPHWAGTESVPWTRLRSRGSTSLSSRRHMPASTIMNSPIGRGALWTHGTRWPPSKLPKTRSGRRNENGSLTVEIRLLNRNSWGLCFPTKRPRKQRAKS